MTRGGGKMIAFIDEDRDVHGDNPICKLLPIVPPTDHAHVASRSPDAT